LYPARGLSGFFYFPASHKADMDELKKVKRYDSLDPSRWMTAPFTRSTEGFLTGRAIVTSVGVFTYKNQDGKISRELRLPDEVFNADSLASMKLKPVTNDHPPEIVTPENSQNLAVGSLGSNPSSTTQERTWDGYTPWEKLTDGLHVAIDMTITRADAIEDILNGKRALSMGYDCEIEKAEEGATWCGMAYDAIQRKIRYNHCAIVDTARAGDAAAIRLDSADAVAVLDINSTPKEGSEMGMKTIRIDGVDFQGDETLVVKYTDQVKRTDTAEKALEKAVAEHKDALSKLEAERDTANDRADKAEEELKKVKADSADGKRLDEMVKAKLAIMDAADRVGVEIKEDMSDLDIKKAVITAVFPSAKLDGKDETYLAARFDSAVETLESHADGESRVIAGENPIVETRTDSTAARKRMIELNRRLSNGEKAEV
jgi:hypothetical protein